MTIPSLFDNRLRLPLIAAPMFLSSGPELVIACCKAGIVGTFPAKNQRTLEGLEAWLDTITTELTAFEAETGCKAAPFGVNLIVHKSNETLQDELAIVAKYKVPLVITSLGAVSDLIAEVHYYGGIVFHDVINMRHARKAVGAGVDGLIAVAAGAGGHTGQANPFGLVNEIKHEFDVTVLLSGSLSSGGDIAAAQMMGADFAYMGTRFIATEESMSQDDYKKMIVDAKASDIVLTDTITGVNASFMTQSLNAVGIDITSLENHGALDINKELSDARDGKTNDITPWRDIWSAGQGVGTISAVEPVASLVDTLAREYHARFAEQTAQSSRFVAYPLHDQPHKG